MIMTPPRELILNAPILIERLRGYKVSADVNHPVHPDICEEAADCLEKFIELGKVMMAGRHALNNLSAHGATIIDFFNCWLDQALEENNKLKNNLTRLEDKLGRLECALFRLDPGGRAE